MSNKTNYVNPKTVTSPKASVRDLRIVFDGGAYDWDEAPGWEWTGWSLRSHELRWIPLCLHPLEHLVGRARRRWVTTISRNSDVVYVADSVGEAGG